ncbi:MAG TPA: ABC transporter substrate-binding protein [Capsulimonadaceae bacterium]|nr:ABC transporter substrate-binding protein [Capsulimonadaceae bacterium]
MRAKNAHALLSLARAVIAIAILSVTAWAFTPARPAPDTPKRIPVHLWHMWSGEWLPVIDRVCDEFNKSQDKYEVIPLEIPWGGGGESDAKFLLSTAGGDPPDVMVQWTEAIDQWAQAGVLSPLDPRMTPAERHHFITADYPAVRRNGFYKGHLYGLTVGFDIYACYWRPDQWRAAGLDPNHFPTSLEALVAAGNKLNQYDSSDRLTRLGFLPQDFAWYAPSFGGGFWDADTGQVELNTPQNLRALSYIYQTHKALGFDRVIRFNAGLKSPDGANWPFIQGQEAVVLDGEWRVKQLAQYAPGVQYRVDPLPPPAGGKRLASFSTADFLTIPAGAKEPEGAWEFIKFWSGLDHAEPAAKFQTWFGWLPTSPEIANAPDYQAYLRQYPQYRTFVNLAASENIETVPPVPYQLFLMDQINNADDLAERGAATPQQALSGLTHDTARELGRRKELRYDQ